MPSVVCKGDVTAVPVGNFTPDPVKEVAVSKLNVDGAAVVASALTTFTENTSGAKTLVSWDPKPGKLRIAGQDILLMGTSGPVAANHLASTSSHKLRVG